MYLFGGFALAALISIRYDTKYSICIWFDFLFVVVDIIFYIHVFREMKGQCEIAFYIHF